MAGDKRLEGEAKAACGADQALVKLVARMAKDGVTKKLSGVGVCLASGKQQQYVHNLAPAARAYLLSSGETLIPSSMAGDIFSAAIIAMCGMACGLHSFSQSVA